MENFMILICVVLVGVDVINIINARILLFDFLIGRRNRKSAQKIQKEQNFIDKVTMGYIYPMLKKHKDAFKRYHTLYLVELYTLVPKYVTVVLLNLFLPAAAKWGCGVLFLMGVCVAVIYRAALRGGHGGSSKYAQK